MSSRAHFLESLLTKNAPPHALVLSRTGYAVATQVELAVDSRSRNRGLLGRSGLSPDAALIIAPCNAVHTFFMRFTIDVVFVTRDGHVLKLCPKLRPWRMAMAVRGFAAIELAAGSIDRAGLRMGDALICTESQSNVVQPSGGRIR